MWPIMNMARVIVMVMILAEVMVLMTKVADEHVTYLSLGKILTGHKGLWNVPCKYEYNLG